MRLRNIFVIAIFGLFLIEVLLLYFDKVDIEQDLLSKSEEVLTAQNAGISIDQVSFIGRDATLTGSVATEEEKARVEQLILGEVWDVRVVDNQLVVAGESDMEPAISDDAPMSGFSLAEGTDQVITLAGTVPSESVASQLVAAVGRAFPGATIEDNLEIEASDASPDWLAPVLDLLPTAGLVDGVMLDAQGLTASLTGSVLGTQQRDAILEDAAAALDGRLALDADLSISGTADVEESEEVRDLRERIATRLSAASINFEIGTATLTAQARAILDGIANDLASASDVQVEIQGHTDNSGSIALNNTLSQQRADAVRQYLIGKGISASRLTARGFGPTAPVATNTTSAGREQNRRVAFRLSGGN